jgi:hypothetical protein
LIISHKHKFIFFKTRKTAGSSIQVTLAKHCGEDDIITGQYRDGIDDDSHSTGLNMDKFWTNHPHPPIKETKQFLGDTIWNNYFKFAFVRNPYEIAVSRYFWEKRGKGKTVEETSIEGFKEWTKTELKEYDMLHPYICISGNIELDFIGKFETLSEDFNYICDKFNIPKIELPVKKGNYRDKVHYTEYYDDDTIEKVNNFYQEDMNLFDYKFNQKFMVKKLHPVILPDMLKNNDGDNINGPSLIKVPKWLKNPLGKYYLYFSHHQGKYIRLAYSDNIEGPYKVYNSGTLKVTDTPGYDHIASPDVHVDGENIVVYYHTKYMDGQYTFRAVSKDGISFISDEECLGKFYFRVFKYKDKYYSYAKNDNVDGIFYESKNGISDFTPIFNFIEDVRHSAVLVKNNKLYLFYTLIGDAPESIYVCEIDLKDWAPIHIEKILMPTKDYEGVNLPIRKSMPGSSTLRYGGPVNEVRDPCVFKEDEKLYLLYSLQGEMGIGISKLSYV